MELRSAADETAELHGERLRCKLRTGLIGLLGRRRGTGITTATRSGCGGGIKPGAHFAVHGERGGKPLSRLPLGPYDSALQVLDPARAQPGALRECLLSQAGIQTELAQQRTEWLLRVWLGERRGLWLHGCEAETD